MATQDELDDARVVAALGRLLEQGAPFDQLPFLNSGTHLFPDSVMAAFDGRYPDAASVVSLETLVNDGRLSEDELNTTIDGAVTAALPVFGAQSLVAGADIGLSQIVAAVCGDSTGDEPSEWVWRGFAMWLADNHPTITGDGYYGFGESGPYTHLDIQQAWSPYFDDTFARTGDVFGSSPDTRGTGTYGGGTGAWTADGTKAISNGGGNSVALLLSSGETGGRRRQHVDGVTIDTTPGASEKVFSYSIGSTTANRLILRIGISTSGVQTWKLQTVIASTVTDLVSGVGSPFTPNAVNTFDSYIEIDGTAVSAKVGALTVTGTLTAPQASAIGSDGRHTILLAGAGWTVRRVWAEKYAATSPTQRFTLYNGSRAGSTAQYAIDRLESLYPADVKIHVLLLSHGQNYAGVSDDAYIAALEEFLAAYRALHPESGIVVCSQNPRYAPQAQVSQAAQMQRCTRLRGWAARNGYGYLPVMEKYLAQADRGQSWVQSDGLHPKTAAHTADPNNGSFQIAELLAAYLDGLSLRP